MSDRAQRIESHWKNFCRSIGEVDRTEDELGLKLVCVPSFPLWLNQYIDVIQRYVFFKLFPSLGEAKILDIGCGTGRWCERMRNRGLSDISGIDIQDQLIHENRLRIRGVSFHVGDIQTLQIEPVFDLITSVTVLQHVPNQDLAIERIHNALKPGGYFLMLENLYFHSDTVFPHSVDGWRLMMKRHGFYLENKIPYDHAYLLRLTERFPESFRKLVSKMSLPLDLWMAGKDFPSPQHCGFLFRKP